jgi:diguanylate cyclase (GGDEF)-like protein
MVASNGSGAAEFATPAAAPEAVSAPAAAPDGVSPKVLAAMLESIATGVCVWDSTLRLVTWNSAYERFHTAPHRRLRAGMRLGEVLDTMAPRLRNETRSGAELEAAALRTLTETGHLEYDRILADGRTVSVAYHPFNDGWIAIYQDVTERRRTIERLTASEYELTRRMTILAARETELQREKLRLEAAINNMSQGLCMFDGRQRLIICNDNYARLYGLPADKVKPGTPLADILAHRIEHGVHPVGGGEAYVQRRIELANSGKEGVDVVELQDGRVISVLHHPMEGGGWVSTHQDITEQRQQEERIRHLARHDALTDLPNRLLFREIMDGAELRVRRGESLAVLAIDLDHFKSVNDTLGHGIGDQVLSVVATRLRACCRDGDAVARLGGDEFAVLTNRLDNATDAAVIAARIVKGMSEPFDVDGRQISIGASIGIAVAPGDGTTAESLLKNADLALYRAKNDGRGAYHFFERGMDAALQERRLLEVALRQALARGEFRLVFQPLFNLKESRISGFETLLRWDHPERGPIPPADFIPVAEDTGMIVAIGEWVLREACRIAAHWPERVNVAVNLSTVQFRNRNLFDSVKGALESSGLSPARLELEVTESLLLTESDATLRMLHRLRSLGVRISMDDFGTGYSSLSYLRSFPFDKIKIDQSFVKSLAAKEDSRAIVKAVIGLGSSLGMSTTAEGVETESQLDLVRQQGCTEVQGFLFSPPLPASAIDKLFNGKSGLEAWSRSLKRSG